MPGIVSVKVAGRDGAVSTGQMVAAVDWVVANADALDIDVLTIAFDSGLGTSPDTDPLAAALDRAWDAGIVVVTAAGNRGADAAGLDSPASDPTLIAVGGVEATDGRLHRSRMGEQRRRRAQPRSRRARARTSAACGLRAARPTPSIRKVSSTTPASSAAARRSRRR